MLIVGQYRIETFYYNTFAISLFTIFSDADSTVWNQAAFSNKYKVPN